MATSPGAAAQLIESLMGGPVEVVQTTVSVGATITGLVLNDPDRVGLTFVNLGLSDAYITPDNQPSATRGISLLASGGSITLNARDDGVLVSSQWSGVTASGSSVFYVVSLRRYGLTPKA